MTDCINWEEYYQKQYENDIIIQEYYLKSMFSDSRQDYLFTEIHELKQELLRSDITYIDKNLIILLFFKKYYKYYAANDYIIKLLKIINDDDNNIKHLLNQLINLDKIYSSEIIIEENYGFILNILTNLYWLKNNEYFYYLINILITKINQDNLNRMLIFWLYSLYFKFNYDYGSCSNVIYHHHIYIILLITYKLIKKNNFYKIDFIKSFIDKILRHSIFISKNYRFTSLYDKIITLKRKLFEKYEFNIKIESRMTFIKHILEIVMYKQLDK